MSASYLLPQSSLCKLSYYNYGNYCYKNLTYSFQYFRWYWSANYSTGAIVVNLNATPSSNSSSLNYTQNATSFTNNSVINGTAINQTLSNATAINNITTNNSLLNITLNNSSSNNGSTTVNASPIA